MSTSPANTRAGNKTLPALGGKLSDAQRTILQVKKRAQESQNDLIRIYSKLDTCITLIRSIRFRCFGNNFFDSVKRKRISSQCDRLEDDLIDLSRSSVIHCEYALDKIHLKLEKMLRSVNE